MTETRYVRAATAKLKQTGERLAVYVPATKGVHVLNATARLLLTYLEEPAGVDELVEMLGRATDGEAEEIRRDLDTVLGEFLEAGIVERVE